MPRNKATITLRKADLRAFNAKMKALKVTPERVDQLMRSKVKSTVEKMKVAAPVDTGRLKTNIKALTGRRKVTFESTARASGSRRDYAPFQEFGTRLIAAHPYFFKYVREYTKFVTTGIRKWVDKSAKKKL